MQNDRYKKGCVYLMNYKGVSCPVCGQPFQEGDDIVVCPECGDPFDDGDIQS